jgi:hypothetical protein
LSNKCSRTVAAAAAAAVTAALETALNPDDKDGTAAGLTVVSTMLSFSDKLKEAAAAATAGARETPAGGGLDDL